VTQLLLSWSEGDRAALEKLIPLVYAELHRLARGYMRREREGHTLQTTALINEAFLKLVDWKNAKWQSRAHFFGISARLMRQLRVSFARARQSAKRGGEETAVKLNEEGVAGKGVALAGVEPLGREGEGHREIICAGDWRCGLMRLIGLWNRHFVRVRISVDPAGILPLYEAK
jgi:hypothetical protein